MWNKGSIVVSLSAAMNQWQGSFHCLSDGKINSRNHCQNHNYLWSNSWVSDPPNFSSLLPTLFSNALRTDRMLNLPYTIWSLTVIRMSRSNASLISSAFSFSWETGSFWYFSLSCLRSWSSAYTPATQHISIFQISSGFEFFFRMEGSKMRCSLVDGYQTRRRRWTWGRGWWSCGGRRRGGGARRTSRRGMRRRCGARRSRGRRRRPGRWRPREERGAGAAAGRRIWRWGWGLRRRPLLPRPPRRVRRRRPGGWEAGVGGGAGRWRRGSGGRPWRPETEAAAGGCAWRVSRRRWHRGSAGVLKETFLASSSVFSVVPLNSLFVQLKKIVGVNLLNDAFKRFFF